MSMQLSIAAVKNTVFSCLQSVYHGMHHWLLNPYHWTHRCRCVYLETCENRNQQRQPSRCRLSVLFAGLLSAFRRHLPDYRRRLLVCRSAVAVCRCFKSVGLPFCLSAGLPALLACLSRCRYCSTIYRAVSCFVRLPVLFASMLVGLSVSLPVLFADRQYCLPMHCRFLPVYRRCLPVCYWPGFVYRKRPI